MRYRPLRNQRPAVVGAIRPRAAGSDGGTSRLAALRRLDHSAVIVWDASADKPCRARDAFGLGANSPRKMKGRGAEMAFVRNRNVVQTLSSDRTDLDHALDKRSATMSVGP